LSEAALTGPPTAVQTGIPLAGQTTAAGTAQVAGLAAIQRRAAPGVL